MNIYSTLFTRPIRYTLFLLLSLAMMIPANFELSASSLTTFVLKQKPKKSKGKGKSSSKRSKSSKKKSSKKSRSSKKSKKSRRSSSRSSRPSQAPEKPTIQTTSGLEDIRSTPQGSSLTSFELISEERITSGLSYKVYQATVGTNIHIAHVLAMDCANKANDIKIVKGKDLVDGLEKLSSMVSRVNSTSKIDKLIGAVNANFWRAEDDTPIGPTVINGEIIEMNSYKKWTSGFFDKDNRLYIGNFDMTGKLDCSNGNKYQISDVNFRKDSIGIVLYNEYAGKEIPFVKETDVTKELEQRLKSDSVLRLVGDDTEDVRSIEELKRDILLSRQARKIDISTPKILLRYLKSPAVNQETKCLVIDAVSEGTVPMPIHGCVVTFGKQYDISELPKVGDTVVVKFATSATAKVPFYNAVCGTPRLVRNGVPKHEAREEGSRSTRFIDHPLPRTAIGTDKKQTVVYIAAIEPTKTTTGTKGVSLSTLSAIMAEIGCYNAMNLDGGGSTAMIVQNKNVLFPNAATTGRSISVGLGISIKNRVYSPKKTASTK